MVESPAIKVAKSVIDRQDRFLSSPETISTMALMQAWDFLIGAPEAVARELSVSDMSRMVVAAATAITSVLEICEGVLPQSAQNIGQRALGKFTVTVHDTTFTLQWECNVGGWGWSATAGNSSESVARCETLEALCEKLRAMPETNVSP